MVGMQIPRLRLGRRTFFFFQNKAAFVGGRGMVLFDKRRYPSEDNRFAFVVSRRCSLVDGSFDGRSYIPWQEFFYILTLVAFHTTLCLSIWLLVEVELLLWQNNVGKVRHNYRIKDWLYHLVYEKCLQVLCKAPSTAAPRVEDLQTKQTTISLPHHRRGEKFYRSQRHLVDVEETLRMVFPLHNSSTSYSYSPKLCCNPPMVPTGKIVLDEGRQHT